ncbi:MAG TPA: orotidine-5'-phosphate decarboxylase [Pyrinomonadaceae bacterium]|nr:orotidine-5'-phosphate decarboxylase [Pyrinomonadaceae bacterium]
MNTTSAIKFEKRVIVALDVQSADEARTIIRELEGEAGAFKIGLQLFAAAGPEFVREVAAEHRVFLDLKFHDIPNTVAGAAVEVARLGVWMFNVHAAGGSEMMRETVRAVRTASESEGFKRPLVIGVTVLTSSDTNTLRETGIERGAEAQVVHLARLAAECGLDGIVSSPREVSAVRRGIDSPGFLIVTPGVRPEFATNDDQKRVMTPRQAAAEGSDYLVIGRPILQAENRVAALRKICDEISASD